MFTFFFKPIWFIVSVLVPLQITIETLHLSHKDSSRMGKTTKVLHLQPQKATMVELLLKYWSLHCMIYLILPHTPLYIIYKLLPFSLMILTAFNLALTRELLLQFINVVEEQNSFINLINKIDNPKASSLDHLTNFLNFTINRKILQDFLFGRITEQMLISTELTKDYPSTNFVVQLFEWIESKVSDAMTILLSSNKTSHADCYNSYKFWNFGQDKNYKNDDKKFRHKYRFNDDYDMMDDIIEETKNSVT
ncbi:hypothetical protein KAFR_0C05200 [Kazachstania africana CBS 2517]|uniref:Uncharacterized protein n=1 Tax=Kazachstania africana (strain ATCC 22294 / BCRC 22015 / CBS 2517 / CECT 1963 / NBRC 1671 / NRRL Y-8276) TaxID=1071382 RepID=H2AT11_KAZAF|nr:hypothetical protein KAFR_0C05200 [Kazachstania africana CBS 2517]CCF57511.1 hypothetical protein KAFR_0C05200 [Kazachstania africana CBS 2517]